MRVMAKIYVVAADAVADVAGEMTFGGYVEKAFRSEKDAEAFVAAIEDTAIRLKTEYTIYEIDLVE